MQKYIKSDIDYDWEYNSFAEAMEDNYDQLLDEALDCNEQAYYKDGDIGIIDIDRDGYISSAWLTIGSNFSTEEEKTGEAYRVLEFIHIGEEQATIDEYALENFYYSKNDDEINQIYDEAEKAGYADPDYYVFDYYPNEILEERNAYIEKLAQDEFSEVKEKLDDAIGDAKSLGV